MKGLVRWGRLRRISGSNGSSRRASSDITASGRGGLLRLEEKTYRHPRQRRMTAMERNARRLRLAGQRLSSLNASGLIVEGRSSRSFARRDRRSASPRFRPFRHGPSLGAAGQPEPVGVAPEGHPNHANPRAAMPANELPSFFGARNTARNDRKPCVIQVGDDVDRLPS